MSFSQILQATTTPRAKFTNYHCAVIHRGLRFLESETTGSLIWIHGKRIFLPRVISSPALILKSRTSAPEYLLFLFSSLKPNLRSRIVHPCFYSSSGSNSPMMMLSWSLQGYARAFLEWPDVNTVLIHPTDFRGSRARPLSSDGKGLPYGVVIPTHINYMSHALSRGGHYCNSDPPSLAFHFHHVCPSEKRADRRSILTTILSP